MLHGKHARHVTYVHSRQRVRLLLEKRFSANCNLVSSRNSVAQTVRGAIFYSCSNRYGSVSLVMLILAQVEASVVGFQQLETFRSRDSVAGRVPPTGKNQQSFKQQCVVVES